MIGSGFRIPGKYQKRKCFQTEDISPMGVCYPFDRMHENQRQTNCQLRAECKEKGRLYKIPWSSKFGSVAAK